MPLVGAVYRFPLLFSYQERNIPPLWLPFAGLAHREGKRVMPSLDWIGKPAVVNHHRKVPYHLLRCDRELSAGDPDAGDLLFGGPDALGLSPYFSTAILGQRLHPASTAPRWSKFSI